MFDNIEKTSTERDFFLAKLDSGGNYIWVYTWIAAGTSEGTAITMDGIGNIYVTGFYNHPSNVYGIFNIPGTGTNDVFIAKIFNNGTLHWYAYANGIGDDSPVAIAFRGNNLAITGNYSRALSIWDPNTPEYPINLPNTMTDNPPILITNAFLITMDAHSGMVKWASRMGQSNTGGSCRVSTINFDSNNNILLAGIFNGNADFFNTTKSSVDGRLFLLKVSPKRELLWLNQIKAWGDDKIVGIGVGAENNIMVLGNFSSRIYFGETNKLDIIGVPDLFWARYASNGEFIRAKALGGPHLESFLSTTCDSAGNIYAIGNYGESGTILGTDTLVSHLGNHNSFLLKLQPDGKIQWTSSFGNSNEYYPKMIGVDRFERIYIGGAFKENISFGDFIVESEEENVGLYDAFIAKYIQQLPQKYIFSGNGLWSSSINWQNNSKPGPTIRILDSVIIASNTDDRCILDASVVFESGSYFHIKENSRLIVRKDFKYNSNPQEDSTFTDPRDGNVYSIKRYGNQVWMTQDLRYRGGTSENVNIYGSFYGWPNPGTSQENPAPPGWHIPSQEEWQTLIDFFGGKEVAGGALKDTLYWDSPNLGATNSSGFNARGGGLLNESYEVEALGEQGFWWTTNVGETQFGTITRGKYIVMGKNFTGVGSGNFEIYLGLKIRCVKD
jgi:uncharacterized protein (TIGR02145 family)